MSKIGNKTIDIPASVSVSVNERMIDVKGPEGTLSVEVPKTISVEKTDTSLTLSRKTEAKYVKALHGLYRQLISNAVEGVVKPWQKRLEIVGTGFNVKMQGEDLSLKVGYSHQVVFHKVDGVKYAVEGNNKIIVSGVDKQLVGQVAHKIKMVRKPDPYKGKGIRYEGEQLKLKPGKKAKTAGA